MEATACPLSATTNRQIIINALLAPDSPHPVSSTCSWQGPVTALSYSYECGELLDEDQVQKALEQVAMLHFLTPPGHELNIQTIPLDLSAPFGSALACIAQNTLCPMHRREAWVNMLADSYHLAIVKAAQTELDNRNAEAKSTLLAYETRILEGVRKSRRRPPMPEPRAPLRGSWHVPRSSAGGTKRGHAPGVEEHGMHRKRARASSSFLDRYYEASIEKYQSSSDPGPITPELARHRSILKCLVLPVLGCHLFALERDESCPEETSVEKFYCCVLREKPETAAEFLKQEKLKWHPDKIDQKYGAWQDKDKLKEIATIIFRVVLRLEKELREKQKEQKSA